jgi:hypothetical protein
MSSKLGVYASYYGVCAFLGVGVALVIALLMRVFLERAAWVDVLMALTLVLGAAGGLGFAERNRRRGNFPPPDRK